jgi:acetyl CoA:N6-hydroxylysine acetyl transferase
MADEFLTSLTARRDCDAVAGARITNQAPMDNNIRFEILSSVAGDVEARADCGGADPRQVAQAAIAFVESLTAQNPSIEMIRVRGRSDAIEALIRGAAAQAVEGQAGTVDLLPSLVWQLPQRWFVDAGLRPYPELRVIQYGRPHPIRPPKPRGTLYRRRIPWLDRELSFRAATEEDADLLHEWMNRPRVAEVWDEAGPIEHHRAYLQGLLADPHVLPLIGALDDRPIGWFEVYYAAENRLGPHYACEDWDRGWHVAIGDESCRGAAHVAAWLPSLMHFMFLDEPRTRRIVGEPRADHAQQINNLTRSGFATIGTVDFAHKRAALVMLTRDRFFRDHLWAPGAAEASLVRTPRFR